MRVITMALTRAPALSAGRARALVPASSSIATLVQQPVLGRQMSMLSAWHHLHARAAISQRLLESKLPLCVLPAKPTGSVSCYSTSTSRVGEASPSSPAAHTSKPTAAASATAPRQAVGAAARVYSSHIVGDREILSQLKQVPEKCAAGPEIMDSIVKVFTVHSRPNHFLPWQVGWGAGERMAAIILCLHTGPYPCPSPQHLSTCCCTHTLVVKSDQACA